MARFGRSQPSKPLTNTLYPFLPLQRTSSTSFSTTLESPLKNSTSSLLTPLETAQKKSTSSLLTINSTPLQNSTYALNTTLETGKTNATTSVLTNLEKNKISSTVALLTSLESKLLNSSLALVSILETIRFSRTESVLSTLEATTQLSLALSSTLEATVKNTVALSTSFLQGVTSVTALNSLLESKKLSSLGLLTINETSTVSNTASLLTTLEEFVIKKTFSGFTLLEVFGKQATLSLISTLETPGTKGTIGLFSNFNSSVVNSTLASSINLEKITSNTFSLASTLEIKAVAAAATLGNTAINTSNATTWTHTVALGLNLGIYVGIMNWNNGGPTQTVLSVSYNSVALANIASTSVNAPSDFANVTWWWLKAPSTGAHTVSVTLSGATTVLKCASYDFSNVDQTIGIDVATTSTGTTGTVSNSLTLSSANEYMLDILAHSSANNIASQTGTSVLADTSSGFLGASQYKVQASSGSQSLTYTMPDPGDDWALSTIAVKASGSATVALSSTLLLGVLNSTEALLSNLEKGASTSVALLSSLQTGKLSSTTSVLTSLESNRVSLTTSVLSTFETKLINNSLSLFSTLETYATRRTSSALLIDGSQNYLSLGTLGNFGSNLGSGFYCKFDIQTSSVSGGTFGEYNSSNQSVYIEFNAKHEVLSSHDITVVFEGANNSFLIASTNSDTTVSFNDGTIHTIIVTINPGAGTMTLSIDGISQTFTTYRNDTGYTYANFPQNFLIGAYNSTGTPAGFFQCKIDNLQVGTSSSNIYGNYQFNEGLGTTTADSSGNGNTATLLGNPVPSWVTGLSIINTNISLASTLEKIVSSTTSLSSTFTSSVVNSSSALYGLLEKKTTNTISLLSILENSGLKSTLGQISILENSGIFSTVNINSTLEATKKATLGHLTLLETNGKNTFGLLGILESILQSKTVASFTVLELLNKKTEALITLLEVQANNTISMNSLLEKNNLFASATVTILEYITTKTVGLSSTLKMIISLIHRPSSGSTQSFLSSSTPGSTQSFLSPIIGTTTQSKIGIASPGSTYDGSPQ